MLEFEPDCPQPVGAAMSPWARRSSRSATSSCSGRATASATHQPYQYLDREYMKADEYDEFMFDPTGFYLTKYLPRVAGAFEGIEEVPYFPGLHYFRLIGGMRAFAKPRMRAALEKIIKAAEEVERLRRCIMPASPSA